MEAARDKGVARPEESAHRSTDEVEKTDAQAHETVRRTSAVIDDADETVRRAAERAKQAVGQEVNRVVDTVTDVVPALPRDPSAPTNPGVRDGTVSSSQQGIARLLHLSVERVDLTVSRLDARAPTSGDMVTFRVVAGTDSLSSPAETDLRMRAPEPPTGTPLPGCGPTAGAAASAAPAARADSAVATSPTGAVTGIDGIDGGFSAAPAFSPGCTPD